MIIRTFKKSETSPYIPMFESERVFARSDELYKPITFHIRSMDAGAYQVFMKKIKTSYNVMTGDTDSNFEDMKRNVVCEFCSRIENLEHPDRGPITTPHQFVALIDGIDADDIGCDAALHNLLDEVYAAIQSRSTLERGVRKNWKTSSDSSETTGATGEVNS